jgi:hypothetical protein
MPRASHVHLPAGPNPPRCDGPARAPGHYRLGHARCFCKVIGPFGGVVISSGLERTPRAPGRPDPGATFQPQRVICVTWPYHLNRLLVVRLRQRFEVTPRWVDLRRLGDLE